MRPVSELATFIAAYRRDQAEKYYRHSEGRERGMRPEVHRDNFMEETGTRDGPLEWVDFLKMGRRAKCLQCIYGLNLGSQ